MTKTATELPEGSSTHDSEQNRSTRAGSDKEYEIGAILEYNKVSRGYSCQSEWKHDQHTNKLSQLLSKPVNISFRGMVMTRAKTAGLTIKRCRLSST